MNEQHSKTSQAANRKNKDWVHKVLEDFWVTFDIHNAAFPANKEDGIFTKDAMEKLDQITKITNGAQLMKVKEGALGLTGHKYFLWKGWGPIAWWDIVENEREVINQPTV